MERTRLLELAGVPITEMEKDSDDIYNAEEAVKKMADIFEQVIDMSGVDQGSSDEWSEIVNDLADMLHEELRNRGLYG